MKKVRLSGRAFFYARSIVINCHIGVGKYAILQHLSEGYPAPDMNHLAFAIDIAHLQGQCLSQKGASPWNRWPTEKPGNAVCLWHWPIAQLRINGILCSLQKSASQYQQKPHSAPTTTFSI
jgi:hypothetical protein